MFHNMTHTRFQHHHHPYHHHTHTPTHSHHHYYHHHRTPMTSKAHKPRGVRHCLVYNTWLFTAGADGSVQRWNLSTWMDAALLHDILVTSRSGGGRGVVGGERGEDGNRGQGGKRGQGGTRGQGGKRGEGCLVVPQEGPSLTTATAQQHKPTQTAAPPPSAASATQHPPPPPSSSSSDELSWRYAGTAPTLTENDMVETLHIISSTSMVVCMRHVRVYYVTWEHGMEVVVCVFLVCVDVL